MKHLQHNSRDVICGLMLMGLALSIAACDTTGPRGSSGGRIDPYATTQSDRKSPFASAATLLEFTDRTAAALAQDIAELELNTQDGKPVLEMGMIVNRTGTPSVDFEMMQRRLRSQLINSPLIRERFIIVESRQRLDQELDRVTDQPAGTTDRYEPQRIYLLSGDFYESTRYDTRRYLLEFTLTHLQSRQTLFSESYDLGQHSD